MPNFKSIFLPLAILVGGGVTGVGAAFSTARVLGLETAEQTVTETELAFVEVADIIAPLAFADGQLSGYAAFTISLEVELDQVEDITARLPLIRHAINMRAYRTPMAAGKDGLLPDLKAFRRLVQQAAQDAFGKGRVKTVAITRAVPA